MAALALAAPTHAAFLDDLNWLGPRFSNAALVGADAVLITNGSAGFLDTFDDGVLDPAWFPLLGTPGPEAGGFLTLEPVDVLLRATGPLNGNVYAAASFALADFPAGSGVGLLVSGESLSDVFALAVTPTAAAVIDENGVVGGVPLAPGPVALMQLLILDNGLVLAAVNGLPVYVGPTTLSSTVSSFGVFVVPEPATGWLLLGAGLAALARRR